jgi:uncharacterized SAM-binding protein YcdF (DUF218 family)
MLGAVWFHRVAIGTIVAALCWLSAWIAARALVVQEPLSRADVLLVLAGAKVYGERVTYAAHLFLDGRAGRIVLTNDGNLQSWSRTLQRNPLSVERATLMLGRLGVPAANIEALQGRVDSTHDEALLMRRYAEAHHVKSIVVVTSGYHTRRASWTLRRVFRGTGIQIGIEPAPPQPDTPSPMTWWWSARGWPMVAGEYMKLVYYRFRYA